MSMQNVGILNKPQAYAQAPVTTPQNKQEKRSDALSTAENKNIIAEHKVLVGAVALASIAVAGILIARGRGKKSNVAELKNNTSIPSTHPATPEAPKNTGTPSINPSVPKTPKNQTPPKVRMHYLDELVQETEEQLHDKVSVYFKAFRDKKGKPEEAFESNISLYREGDWEKFKQYLDFRIKNVMFLQNQKKPIPADTRELDIDDVSAVVDFLNEKAEYNCILNREKDVSGNANINCLRRLIKEAKPLEDEAFVYQGVRTQKLFGNREQLDFVEGDFQVGDTLIDKGFVSASRTYDTDLASADPLLLADPYRNSGFIMRIRLPKGTKGLDCRRLSQIDSDRGVNSTFILPPESKFEITGFDFPRRILDCNYILPE